MVPRPSVLPLQLSKVLEPTGPTNAMKRPQEITLGEMRAQGERGLVVFCSDYRCSHNVELAPAINGAMMSGSRILSPICVPSLRTTRRESERPSRRSVRAQLVQTKGPGSNARASQYYLQSQTLTPQSRSGSGLALSDHRPIDQVQGELTASRTLAGRVI